MINLNEIAFIDTDGFDYADDFKILCRYHNDAKRLFKKRK